MPVFAIACVAASGMSLAASPPSVTPTNEPLQHALDALAQRARPGTLGVAVLDLKSGAAAGVDADRAFPMMSVFKAPVAAAVLSRIDDGSLSLQQSVTVTRDQVMGGSAIPSLGAHFHGERMSFTVEQLLKAAVTESDNTAVNALIRVAGGPGVVTTYLHAHGIDGMRVDVDEAGIAQVFHGLRPGELPPAHESDAAADQRFQSGYQAFLADPRNRSTPDAAIAFLRKLVQGELLSPVSTQRLLALMEAQTIPNRLRAGLPAGLRFADKTGTSGSLGKRTAAFNDIGIIRWPDGHTVLVAAFLMDSPASDPQRAALFADMARTVASSVQP
ncbi:class A beta-lactamase [Dyella japonica]|uniref:Beta-lactamase n=1 Tax=Dyella japonica DSM 16301 TaxID=1440762 RepID=A0A0G9H3W8_9GAMM|nr:class A beta-lactamase [Dyella japonica]KLD64545.1 beta-lactamase [Dyella japonica DSM 16301]